MDPKSLLATIARLILASIAGTLVKDGYLQSSGTEAFIGVGMMIATGLWGVWNSYGKDIAKAELELLRARVLNAAAKAQSPDRLQALASVAAHVQATAPPAAPAASAAPPVAPMVVLAIGLSALAIAWAGPAGAQTVAQRTTRPPLTGNIPADINNAVKGQAMDASGNALNAVGNALAKPFQDLANFIGDDSAGAVALATAIPELQDGHGQQCWMAMKQFGEVAKAHPVPLTLKLLTDVEAFRLMGMAANNLCANPHCTQVFADMSNAVEAMSPINSVPIPSLNALCSKVPQVSVAPPVTVPAVPATPATPAAQ